MSKHGRVRLVVLTTVLSSAHASSALDAHYAAATALSHDASLKAKEVLSSVTPMESANSAKKKAVKMLSGMRTPDMALPTPEPIDFTNLTHGTTVEELKEKVGAMLSEMGMPALANLTQCTSLVEMKQHSDALLAKLALPLANLTHDISVDELKEKAGSMLAGLGMPALANLTRGASVEELEEKAHAMLSKFGVPSYANLTRGASVDELKQKAGAMLAELGMPALANLTHSTSVDELKEKASAVLSGLGVSALANLTNVASVVELKQRAGAMLSDLGLPALANLTYATSVEELKANAATMISTATAWFSALDHQANSLATAAANASVGTGGLALSNRSTPVPLAMSFHVTEEQTACLREVQRDLRLRVGHRAGWSDLTDLHWVDWLWILYRFVDHCEPIERACMTAFSDVQCMAGAAGAYSQLSTAIDRVHDVALTVNQTAESLLGALPPFVPARALRRRVAPVGDMLFSVGNIDVSVLQSVDGCAELDTFLVDQCARLKASVAFSLPIPLPMAVVGALGLVGLVVILLVIYCCSCCLVGCYHVTKCHIGCCCCGCGCELWPGCCGRGCFASGGAPAAAVAPTGSSKVTTPSELRVDDPAKGVPATSSAKSITSLHLM